MIHGDVHGGLFFSYFLMMMWTSFMDVQHDTLVQSCVHLNDVNHKNE